MEAFIILFCLFIYFIFGCAGSALLHRRFSGREGWRLLCGRGPPSAVVSLGAELRLQGTRASVVAAPGLWSTGSVAVEPGLPPSAACVIPQLRDGGGEAHHVLVAGIRFGAGVAAAVPVSVAIFHCGTKMRAPHPGEPGGPDQGPPADRPTRAGPPRACAPHSRRCSSSRSR